MSPALDMLLKTEYDRGYGVGYAKGEALGYAKGEEICKRIMNGESNADIAQAVEVSDDEVEEFRILLDSARQ